MLTPELTLPAYCSGVCPLESRIGDAVPLKREISTGNVLILLCLKPLVQLLQKLLVSFKAIERG